ncbi:hypothetical protein BMS3Bbin10_00191 [bacterium BMS3Bbin10]|nr:hypothetical protein BMS3Bbin10_00191 [bacterium BMS3Bbin10]HDL16745.1 hypothetical protein [Hyphomicrobiales bacterium]
MKAQKLNEHERIAIGKIDMRFLFRVKYTGSTGAAPRPAARHGARCNLVRITDKREPVIGKMIREYKKLDRGFDSIKT